MLRLAELADSPNKCNVNKLTFKMAFQYDIKATVSLLGMNKVYIVLDKYLCIQILQHANHFTSGVGEITGA